MYTSSNMEKQQEMDATYDITCQDVSQCWFDNAECVGATKCVDSNPQCRKWASVGECRKDPSWMLPNCKLSCNMCSTERWIKKGGCTNLEHPISWECDEKSCSTATQTSFEEILKVLNNENFYEQLVWEGGSTLKYYVPRSGKKEYTYDPSNLHSKFQVWEKVEGTCRCKDGWYGDLSKDSHVPCVQSSYGTQTTEKKCHTGEMDCVYDDDCYHAGCGSGKPWHCSHLILPVGDGPPEYDKSKPGKCVVTCNAALQGSTPESVCSESGFKSPMCEQGGICRFDCEYGAWSDWSDCTKECSPGGTSKRTRSVVQNRYNLKCTDTTETKSCNTDVDCDSIRPLQGGSITNPLCWGGGKASGGKASGDPDVNTARGGVKCNHDEDCWKAGCGSPTIMHPNYGWKCAGLVDEHGNVDKKGGFCTSRCAEDSHCSMFTNDNWTSSCRGFGGPNSASYYNKVCSIGYVGENPCDKSTCDGGKCLPSCSRSDRACWFPGPSGCG